MCMLTEYVGSMSDVLEGLRLVPSATGICKTV